MALDFVAPQTGHPQPLVNPLLLHSRGGHELRILNSPELRRKGSDTSHSSFSAKLYGAAFFVGLCMRGFQVRSARASRIGRGSRASTQMSAALDLDTVIDVKKKVGRKTDAEEETSTSRDMWAVTVHAPIRNCKMPWCKIPGLRKIICTCLKDGVEPGSGIRSKDGKCALTLEQYAEVLSEGVPLLSRGKAYEVSSRLFESAMANPVGTAVVITTFKKGAEEYHKRLKDLGLWTSVQPLDRDD
eukprot:TRINITY_DN37639_c1_g1_i1.p1 TRINITY_DN37639_c1_g1~~TRINITY_DN37639_c1_g1_i1.p1  ORF type:complete len:243 (+),score=28.03 TRINITY_DN37639_c1_g1_i1:100-828(+)